MDLPSRERRAFTLVELLVVMGIISILVALSSVAFTSLGGANTFATSASGAADLLQEARAYAMANNTYVYVGLQEASSASATTGIGHITIMIVASVNGIRPYGNTPGMLTSAEVAPVGKLVFFENVHLTSSNSVSNGNTSSRPAPTSLGFVDLSASVSTVTFQWPLVGTAQHSFGKVIEFDPQGIAKVQTSTTFDPAIPSYIEIALVPTHGTTLSATNANDAAIQLDGMTGNVRTYLP